MKLSDITVRLSCDLQMPVPLNACLILRTYQNSIAVSGRVRCRDINVGARHWSNSELIQPLNS